MTRLNAPPSEIERRQLEKALAVARFALAIVSAFAALLDETEPAEYSRLVLVLLALWAVYSLGVVVWVRLQPAGRYLGVLLLAGDILWPAFITIYTHGPSSPLFPLFVFAIIEAAFRWGFPETMLVCGATVSLMGVQALILTGSTRAYHELSENQFEINRLIIRLSYLFVIAYLMGRLGENEKTRRAERIAINRVLLAARVEHGMVASLREVFGEVMNIFRAEQAFFVAHDVTEGRVFLWHGPRRGSSATEPFVTEKAEHTQHLLMDWPAAFVCEKRSDGRTNLKSLRNGRFRKEVSSFCPAVSFFEGTPIALMSASSDLGQEWHFRLFLVNPSISRDVENELRFAENLVQQAVSAIYSVYLVRRLRSRAGAMERARVAREIHDGAIQSLISAEMRVDVLRRRSEQQAPTLAPELEGIQELLREEVLSLRELMQQMRPVVLGPQQLLDFLADTVERFRRDSGIDAHFLSHVQEDVSLTPHVCRELVRITQEALTNVRKHAQAHTVLVTFAHADQGGWRLTVADDGRGFEFNGTVRFDDLLSSPKGPAVIKERVHGIGGELTVDSQPGRGCKLEITLHQRGSFPYGR